MGLYDEHVLPRMIDLTLGTKAIGKLRTRAMQGLSGEVLEVGFGSGTNVPYYPAEVERVLAVDPSSAARRLAARRLEASRVLVELVGLDGQALPLADDSVDNALSTWTLCTIPDVGAALGEIRRVLRPGGQLFLLEHGLSDDPKVVRWQRRLAGIQQRVGGGCHPERDIEALVGDAGFETDHITTFTIAGPRYLSYLYAGTARPTR